MGRFFKRSYFLVVLLSLITSCTRPKEENKNALVNFSFPTTASSMSEKMSGKLSSLSAASSLVHVSISVSGPGIPGNVLFEWDHCRDCISAPLPPTQFELIVPAGESRFFQVMTVYEGNAGMIFKYGDSTTTIAGENATVAVPMSDLTVGEISTGRVSGRYLTGADVGPTGRVEIRYRPPGKPPMVVSEEQIINGWFSFFMLGGLDFEYYVKSTGQTLWGGPVNLHSDLISPNLNPAYSSFNPTQTRMKMFVPVHKRYQNPAYDDEDLAHNVWGYYADSGNAALVSSKKICVEPTSVTKLFKYDNPGTILLSPIYKHNPTSSDFIGLPTYAQLNNAASPYASYVILGGKTFAAPNYCDGSPSGNENSDFIKVGLANIDGNGNDSLAGFRGVFKKPNSLLSISAPGANRTISGYLMPGTNILFSKIKAFKRQSTNHENRIETPDCNRLISQGFTFAGEDTTIATDVFDITTSITDAEASAGVEVVLCPALATDILAPVGAIHLDRQWLGYVGAPPYRLGVSAKVNATSVSNLTNGTCGQLEMKILDSNNMLTQFSTPKNVRLTVSGPTLSEFNFYYDSSSCENLSAALPTGGSYLDISFSGFTSVRSIWFRPKVYTALPVSTTFNIDTTVSATVAPYDPAMNLVNVPTSSVVMQLQKPEILVSATATFQSGSCPVVSLNLNDPFNGRTVKFDPSSTSILNSVTVTSSDIAIYDSGGFSNCSSYVAPVFSLTSNILQTYSNTSSLYIRRNTTGASSLSFTSSLFSFPQSTFAFTIVAP